MSADRSGATPSEPRPVRSCRHCGLTLRQHLYAGYGAPCDDFEEREDDSDVLTRVDNLVLDYLTARNLPPPIDVASLPPELRKELGLEERDEP